MNIVNFCNKYNIDIKQYFNIVDLCNQPNSYYSFNIIKKDGGFRTINAPRKEIKDLQIKIKQILENKYIPSSACHGFTKGRSCKTNASMHINKKWCLNIDISDFFPSINFGRIRGLFKSSLFGFDNGLATTLAIICCYDKKLPQGAPTSPVLSNIICYSLDKQLIKLAAKNKCVYSRYVDDMTFSTNLNKFPRNIASIIEDNIVELSDDLLNIVQKNGFTINSNKTRLASKTQCQMVTGIVVNKKTNLKRKYYRQLRSILYNCKKLGLKETAIINHKCNEMALKNFILGKISYYKNIVGENHTSYNTLCKLYNSNIEYKFGNCYYSKQELKDKAVFIIEYDNMMQGTCFLLKGYGLITCKHCLNINEDYFNWDEDAQNVENRIITSKCKVFSADNHLDCYECYVKKIYKDYDCVILESKELEKNKIAFNPHFGYLHNGLEKCSLLGFPNYSNGSTIQDTTNIQVISKKDYFNTNYYCIDKIVVSGSSGGPFLNDKNEVIGIACRGGNTIEEASNTDFNGILSIDCLKQCN